MNVRFFDKYGSLKKEFSSEEKFSNSYQTETLSSDIILYVDVKGSGTIKLNFELKDDNLDIYFPYQYDDGIELVNYERILKEGKYRIILPTTKNEDMIKVLFECDNVDANLYLIPNYFQF